MIDLLLVATGIPRFMFVQTDNFNSAGAAGSAVDRTGGSEMALLWLLVALLIIFAIVGGAAVSNWLFLILVIALVLIVVGAFS
jgi:hypothetical protein